MHPKLTHICKAFETLKGFLDNPTFEKTEKLNRLFFEFLDYYIKIINQDILILEEIRIKF